MANNLYIRFTGLECCRNCKHYEGLTSTNMVICNCEDVSVKVNLSKIVGDCFYFDPIQQDIRTCDDCDKKFVCLLADIQAEKKDDTDG